MEKWVEIRKSGDFNKTAKECGISPITARILRNKDLVSSQEISEYLSPVGVSLNSPFDLNGMDRVIFYLKGKIKENKKIRIIGDYDVDGICSTFILHKGLSFFKADCDYCIPHRIEDGYGINIKLIKEAYEAGRDTIITCDNGISAKEQTDYAHSLNMTMLITDHHEVPFETDGNNKTYIIPDAEAIVDPHLPDCNYNFKGICGAYVAFQVILALAIDSGVENNKDFILLKEELLEFVSLATVCDVMELKNENRSLVKQGLKYMEKSKNKGLKALLEVTGMTGFTLTPYHLGFVIGPCLNASGRLDTSLRAMDLFLEEDYETALKKADNLKALNEERKDMTISETEKAFKIVDEYEKLPDILVVYLPNCHESLAGIIAGRVREKYSRPAFVVTKTENGLKGSGRSIEAYDMFEGLNASNVKGLLSKFGGHKLAAGISLESEEKLALFTKALNENSKLTEDDFCEIVKIDMELPLDYASLALALELKRLEPYGVGNDKPLFALRSLTFISGYRIGKNKNVGKYKVRDEFGRIYEMIYFGDLDALENYVASIYDDTTSFNFHSGNRINVVLGVCYQLDINSYKGNDSAKLILKYYR